MNSPGEARGPDSVRFQPVRVLPSRSDGCNSSFPAEFGEFRLLSGGASDGVSEGIEGDARVSLVCGPRA